MHPESLRDVDRFLDRALAEQPDERPRRLNYYHVYNGPTASEDTSEFTHDTTTVRAATFEDALQDVIDRGWFLVDGQALILVENGELLRVFEYVAPAPAHFHLI